MVNLPDVAPEQQNNRRETGSLRIHRSGSLLALHRGWRGSLSDGPWRHLTTTVELAVRNLAVRNREATRRMEASAIAPTPPYAVSSPVAGSG